MSSGLKEDRGEDWAFLMRNNDQHVDSGFTGTQGRGAKRINLLLKRARLVIYLSKGLKVKYMLVRPGL